MKKLLASLILLLALTGCGDDVTNINGYTDAEVKAMIDSTLGAQDVVVMNDTVYQQTVDTIYDMVIDTVTHELVDTIYQRVVDTVYNDLVDTIYTRVVDTVMNELVDTIYQRVVDTVYHELVDTIYTKVIDTVFTELEKVGVDIVTEVPRDTTVIFYDTLANSITAKIYQGYVYKNVFYEKTLYSTEYCNGGRSKCASVAGGGMQGNYANQCGELSRQEDDGYSAYVANVKRLPNARIADLDDMHNISKFITELYPEANSLYAGGYMVDKYGNVLPYDRSANKYICAYDLK